MQNKAGGEGDAEEVQNGAQDSKPAPGVEEVQSGGLFFMLGTAISVSKG